MNATPVTKDKEQKNGLVNLKTSSSKSGKKNEIKISYTAERVDPSKLPTIRDGIQYIKIYHYYHLILYNYIQKLDDYIVCFLLIITFSVSIYKKI